MVTRSPMWHSGRRKQVIWEACKGRFIIERVDHDENSFSRSLVLCKNNRMEDEIRLCVYNHTDYDVDVTVSLTQDFMVKDGIKPVSHPDKHFIAKTMTKSLVVFPSAWKNYVRQGSKGEMAEYSGVILFDLVFPGCHGNVPVHVRHTIEAEYENNERGIICQYDEETVGFIDRPTYWEETGFDVAEFKKIGSFDSSKSDPDVIF